MMMDMGPLGNLFIDLSYEHTFDNRDDEPVTIIVEGDTPTDIINNLNKVLRKLYLKQLDKKEEQEIRETIVAQANLMIRDVIPGIKLETDIPKNAAYAIHEFSIPISGK
jgi:hypothetical protein